ncbi:MAG: hypothetical protein A3I04_05005 [Nitrospinae bacterium RIFCSPLOWO2_02_FULL_39_110]|nr:MAG: hypothetical protein A2W53_05735 [Nitrospinae bacterium RIFCSPHIGHO2_02_39_11]OGV98500.1 MAG: hypothetical protein A3D97_04065 [Nitrospinae bacterium RIFCSPHIGHO2_12_FULL_39_42]OGW00486.1 MAG: hypothetical protein A3D20_05035 [Nitrospinae bacterium RIFCSPHIGHO2_02_FULL_39_82]OGW04883.1 MAG: hypothetical protein A3I04_05005 [Nitrospinae bacterium RIFCSPLOWO2_02_FULL_39_110]OGW07608.1 MAG: hypothetical protein A2Z59_07650 [Nitrospinae bacterium RIFCSPLOWO2_02_39_17]OGW09292.1 MAG: hypoth
MRIITGLAVSLLIVFLNNVCPVKAESQKREESIRDLITRLNNEYISIDESLKKLEKNIWNFPSTTLNISVVNRNSEIKLISIELLDGIKLLESHFYTPLENEALWNGGRHQFFHKEVREGNRRLVAVYYWVEGNKPPSKGEEIISVNITWGKDTFVQFFFEKKDGKVDLQVSQIDFKQ